MVRVAFAPYGEYEGCEKASDFEDFKEFKFPDIVKSQLHFSDLVVVRPAFLEIDFSTFMGILQSSNNSDISAYLEYSSIPSLLPELEQDIKEMPFVSGELKRRHLNIWLSNGNTLGKLHFDPYDNFLCQVSHLEYCQHTNSPNWSSYNSYSLKLGEFVCRRKHAGKKYLCSRNVLIPYSEPLYAPNSVVLLPWKQIHECFVACRFMLLKQPSGSIFQWYETAGRNKCMLTLFYNAVHVIQ